MGPKGLSGKIAGHDIAEIACVRGCGGEYRSRRGNGDLLVGLSRESAGTPYIYADI